MFLRHLTEEGDMQMDATTYDIWAMRINEAIRAGKKSGTGQEKTKAPAGLKEVLLGFAAEAAAIVGAIGRNIADVEILGADRSATMEGFLDQMLRFDDFSLMEYRYKIGSSKQQPGLRFKVETQGKDKRIAVHFFEDLVFWPVDEQGRRVFREPIHFDVTGGVIKAIPRPDFAPLYAACTTWQTALRETLALPFRHLYDPGWGYGRLADEGRGSA
jgi:hypothetical protein